MEVLDNNIFLSLLFISFVILLLVMGIIITFFLSGRQRSRQQIVLAENKLAFERELRQVDTEVRENMMSHFAQELHDNIGQLLTALHFQVENQKLDFPELAAGFTSTESYISEIRQQLRILSRTLNNDFLVNIGLSAAIQLEVDRLKSLKRFNVSCSLPDGSSNLEKNQELMVFRIFQEIAQNIMRHSLAQNMWVEVINSNNGFSLSVKDDGRGFDKDVILQSPKASGLRNIINRAKLAGLQC